MDTIRDFEDLLELFTEHEVRYLIVGGLAAVASTSGSPSAGRVATIDGQEAV